MKLYTKYLGLQLKNPIIVASSKLTNNIANIKKCSDFGAGAVVLKSIYDVQLLPEHARKASDEEFFYWYPQHLDNLYKFSPDYAIDKYTDLIKASKNETDIPIIASIQCKSVSNWTELSHRLAEAGADALELNIYVPPYDKSIDSRTIEDDYIDIVEAVRRYVKIPIAVKIGYHFTNLVQVCHRLSAVGADGIVLFNRFFRPDIDIENETVVCSNMLSDPNELTLSLRWVSLISNELRSDVCGGRGIHDANGVIKMLLAGATTVQICSAFYHHGLGYIDTLLSEIEAWMESKDYETIDDFRGKIAKNVKNKAYFEQMQFHFKPIV